MNTYSQSTTGNKNAPVYHSIDPTGKFISTWNRIFLACCLIGLFLDPLFLYVPYVGAPVCVTVHWDFLIGVTVIRSLADLLYLTNMILRFRTAFLAGGSKSNSIGRGDMVMGSKKIATQYFKTDFIIDFAASLPLPQFMYWDVIMKISATTAVHSNNLLALVILIQYVPRFIIIFPLIRRIIWNSGFVTRTAWAGIAYNFSLYVLASHVMGASWYLLSIQRQYDCWFRECNFDKKILSFLCHESFLDCNYLKHENLRAMRSSWLNSTDVLHNCDPTNEDISFMFGIFRDPVTTNMFSAEFSRKFFYCLWFGLRTISSFGQNLAASNYVTETVFCAFLCVLGIVLMGHLIINIQKCMQSATETFEDRRVQTTEVEEWMRLRQIPSDLQQNILRYMQYHWTVTMGQDEDSILNSLPPDLRRSVKRHLSLDLIRQVRFISSMDNRLQDAVCERLVSYLCIKDMHIVQEGDPVTEMVFIVKGRVESSTTDGGRVGFYNAMVLGPGDFCCEELLPWALNLVTRQMRPLSTRTVRALTKVETFALRADDLRFIATYYNDLHSWKISHTFRLCSPLFRTWGARFIQVMWRRFVQRRLNEGVMMKETLDVDDRDNESKSVMTILESQYWISNKCY